MTKALILSCMLGFGEAAGAWVAAAVICAGTGGALAAVIGAGFGAGRGLPTTQAPRRLISSIRICDFPMPAKTEQTNLHVK
jgi:hypothetical protein